MAYLSPFSQTLESERLLAPGAITAMINAQNTVSRISKILEEKGSAAFYIEELFPTLTKQVWPHIKESNCAPIFRRTRQDDPESEVPSSDSPELANKTQLFHEYPMITKLDNALSKARYLFFYF